MGTLDGRLDYDGEGIREDQLPGAPWEAVESWVRAAVDRSTERGDVPEPLALSVATVDEDGMPDVRTVLLRLLDPSGPAFLTCTTSEKGRQLAANPGMAASLTWPSMFRAIRFRGAAELLPRQDVEAYFRTRPYGSRISAHTSAQSRPVADREALEAAYERCEQRWPDTGSADDVPVPDHWGGYRLLPDRVELWGGRRSRLHDRILWERCGPGGLDVAGAWRRFRLQP